ncbi:MAG: adenosine deaminase [Anaerolineae bacterium]|nr:adenosine deaminase [Anaerolineae bacterium]MDW8172882.1 adenosine deaminase [Anaerolineae bacterium]
MFPVPPDLLAIVQAMPKIELHRHLEGSLRLSSLLDIARQYGMAMAEYDEETLQPFVQMMPDETRDSRHFLNKFLTLRQFYRSMEVIERLTREVVEDAAADNVRYMELRFTPRALCAFTQAPLDEVVRLVCQTGNQAARASQMNLRYIVSMNRHEGVELGEQVLRAALRHCADGVVGLDLAGDEAGYSALPFLSIFRRAKAEGLFVTIHAGEWAGAESVWDAVGSLKADRIGHGIHVLEDMGMVEVLRRAEIALEICPSSNVLSGIVDSLEAHPLALLTSFDLLTTINTDDPSVCAVTLSEEMARAVTYMGLSLDDLRAATLRAAKAAFLPPTERADLLHQMSQALSTPSI